MTNVVTFKQHLVELMKLSGTTQEKLASHLGISRQSISQYTRGTTLPEIETFCKICLYFNVSSDYMLGLESTKGEQGLRDLVSERSKTILAVANYLKEVTDKLTEVIHEL